MGHEKYMKYHEHYIRRDDDSANSTLRVQKIETGEIQVRIYDWDTGEEMGVGFTNYIGGGRSPNVLKALENLAFAIEKDNKEHPITEHDLVTQEQFYKNRLTLNRRRQRRRQAGKGHQA
jgi:hypothetical protein